MVGLAGTAAAFLQIAVVKDWPDALAIRHS